MLIYFSFILFPCHFPHLLPCILFSPTNTPCPLTLHSYIFFFSRPASASIPCLKPPHSVSFSFSWKSNTQLVVRPHPSSKREAQHFFSVPLLISPPLPSFHLTVTVWSDASLRQLRPTCTSSPPLHLLQSLCESFDPPPATWPLWFVTLHLTPVSWLNFTCDRSVVFSPKHRETWIPGANRGGLLNRRI